MKHLITFILFFNIIFFNSCKKENRINKKLEGSWVFTEYSNRKAVISDFSDEKRTFQFFKSKNAYTSTMTGIYRIDYTDVNKFPVIDTFEYQLKNNELDITKVKNKKVNGVFSNSFIYLRRRFKIEKYKNEKLKLVRIDSTDLYIKATKQ